jgi:aspartyl/asparaginyl beta-hydroxylase (cupin superfamily)
MDTQKRHPFRSRAGFDDSYVHAAMHAGAEERIVLLVDVPHPDLVRIAPSRRDDGG